MSNVPTESVYREAGCVFRINRKTGVLAVEGQPEQARLSILKLRKEGWLPRTLRAIVFESESLSRLITGKTNLTLFLTSRPEPQKPSPRTFKELVNSKGD